MTSLSDFFKNNQFFVAAKIIESPKNFKLKSELIFEFEPEFETKGKRGADCGWVYAWVGASGAKPEFVLYVGKAGQSQTFKKRCGQHRSGFTSSVTGQKMRYG